MRAAFFRFTYLSAFVGIKEALIFVESKTIGHAGDIIANDSFPAIKRKFLLIRARQQRRVLAVGLKELG